MSGPEQASDAPLFDAAVALARANGSRDLARRIFYIFQDDLRQDMAQMEMCIESDDGEGLRACLHHLAGGVTYTGALRLQARVETARHLLRSAAAPSAVPEALQRLLATARETLAIDPDREGLRR